MDAHPHDPASRERGLIVANPIEEVEGAIPQYVYTGPWEDVRLTA